MGIEIKLLIVEDDNEQYQTYEDTAYELSNPRNGLLFNLTRETNSQSAEAALLSKNFDAAIVDLNLMANDTAEASGNEILKKIVGNLRFPVFVVSGNLGMLDQQIEEKKSSFLKFYSRDTQNKIIFDEIKKICSTGITNILGGRGLIEEKLADIFWNHLANDLDIWVNKETTSEKALLRYAISHLSEYLDLSTGENDYYDEAEFYIKPPIRDYISTGDIIQSSDGTRFIVLSPACDVAVRKLSDDGKPIINAKRISIAKLIEVNRESFINNEIIKSDAKNSDGKACLDRIIKGQQEKYIFLPEYKPLSASVIDLQNLHAIDFKEYENFDRIATVSSPFLKEIQSRFSSYYARQGQPDLNKDNLIKKHKNAFNNSG